MNSTTHHPAATAGCASVSAEKVTQQTLAAKKSQSKPISCLTAYDYATARIVDEAGIDVILVGDSLAMVMQGLESTLPITMDEMCLYTRGVRRAVRRALLVADMPFGSYQTTEHEGVANALRFVKEAGAEAVKIEGGMRRAPLVERLVNAEISVLGHIGLTPQSVHQMGGYKVQGRTAAAMDALLSDALTLEHAGAFAIVLEGIPREVAKQITAELSIPTIGIGAGPDCDGQVLVVHDLAGMTFTPPAKFARRYAALGDALREAVTQYRQDVESRNFPSDAESYHLPTAMHDVGTKVLHAEFPRRPRRHA
jgi:3-methyl-2-oxobutanoate hydroxymethyltransferase